VTIPPIPGSSRRCAASGSASKPGDVRRLLLASTLTIVVAILILFGVPLGIVVDRAIHSDAQSRLQREAMRVARDLNRVPAGSAKPTSADLDRLVPAGDRVMIIYPNGSTIANQTRISHALAATVSGPEGQLVRVASPADATDD